MLKSAITLDAGMSAGEVLERLALQGFWTSTTEGPARNRIEPLARRLRKPAQDVAKKLARDVRRFGAGVRRQSGTRVLWYPFELQEVLEGCARARPEVRLRDVLQIENAEAPEVIHLPSGGEITLSTGVVMDGRVPVAVSLASFGYVAGGPRPNATLARSEPSRSRSASSATISPRDERPWPRIDAPAWVRPATPFELVVGFGRTQQAGVAGGPVTLNVPSGVEFLDLTVHLSATGLDAADGWMRPMRVAVADILAAEVRFQLTASEPTDAELPHLSTLEVRYVLDGVVCGTAARPLVILHSQSPATSFDDTHADSWSRSGSEMTDLSFTVDENAPDLTIEISKPDRDIGGNGQYVCQWFSRHALDAPRGPFRIDLGHDARTFAKDIVDEIALFARSELLDATLTGIGRLVAERLPRAIFEALRHVAAKTAPQAPTVMIVSAEPYIPWELAWIEPPLDEKRPQYLGAQAVVGRWLRDFDAASPSENPNGRRKPALHPAATQSIKNMVVMAAWYKAASGLARLRKSEAETQSLAASCNGIELHATARAVRDLLRGNADAVHFSGHGEFDPNRPDGSSLFLEDGTPLRSTMFRATSFADAHQPLLFLNACMLGIGGELLGDMAGFPGNSLRGGFGGVIGALWEIEDRAAEEFALEFWRRALPPPPAKGEPVGAILRDLRAKYVPDAEPPLPATFLSYVYYGHPNLTLERVPL